MVQELTVALLVQEPVVVVLRIIWQNEGLSAAELEDWREMRHVLNYL